MPEQGSGDASRLLCPVGALLAYVERTRPLWKGSRFFVCFGQTKLVRPASKQRLSHWLVGAIAVACSVQGFRCRQDLWATPLVACYIVGCIAGGLPQRDMQCCDLVFAMRLHPLL